MRGRQPESLAWGESVRPGVWAARVGSIQWVPFEDGGNPGARRVLHRFPPPIPLIGYTLPVMGKGRGWP